MIHSFAGGSHIVAFILSGVIFCLELAILGCMRSSCPVNLTLMNNGAVMGREK